MWIVDPHEFDIVQRHAFESIEVGHPAIGLGEVVSIYFCLNKPAGRRVSGISGIRYQYTVAGIQECERYVQDALLEPMSGCISHAGSRVTS